VPRSHPDHLYVVGRLHGLPPAKPDIARVLEVGCGTGGNLLPMAATLPLGRFMGIDLSERKIEIAQAGARAGDLNNVEFMAGDTLALLEGRLGETFDYIVLPGLYSRVFQHIQAALLPLCRRLLAGNGVVYVGYDTYPGWHGRGLARDLMLRAGADIAEPAARAAAARRALDEMIPALAQVDDAYAKLLEEESARVAELEDGVLLHDLLAVENHPLYVDEFLARASEAGLQFVSEANVAASRDENFSPEARRQLAAIKDTAGREQRIDFVLNRGFRQTLLCPAEAVIHRRIEPGWLAEMHLASPLRPLGPGPNGAPGEVFFATPDGGRIGMTAPNAIAALNHLALAWPAFISFRELAARVGDGAIVARLAIDLYPRNWLDLAPRPPAFTTTPGPRPEATALARWQMRQGAKVTDQRHRCVTITDGFTRQLLLLLDGRRDRYALLRQIARFERGADPLAADGDAESVLDAALRQLAERCLLVQ
jgi:SAM-dependent methyltransferase